MADKGKKPDPEVEVGAFGLVTTRTSRGLAKVIEVSLGADAIVVQWGDSGQLKIPAKDFAPADFSR